jgi:menaquinone-dependent protoporphyrinogen oxidase
MTVLVAYGSKHGGTRGIAELVGQALNERGLQAEVRAADDVTSVGAYKAVIVGGALYAMRWHRSSRRFVKRHAYSLREVPVWMFSSGPLDVSAMERDIPPVRQVRVLMHRVGARGHMTFGGRLEEDVKGYPASAMAKKHAGDWRDRGQIHRWADEIATALTSTQAVSA